MSDTPEHSAASRMPFALLPPVLVIAADQATKMMALNDAGDSPRQILPFFNLVLVHNRGISFGLFRQDTATGPIALMLVSLLIAVFFAFWLRRVESKPLAVAIGAVIGGALGNVIDRIRFGAVVDFLDFHWGDWHWPAFNVADSCIVGGIAFIVLDGLLFEPKRKTTGPA